MNSDGLFTSSFFNTEPVHLSLDEDSQKSFTHSEIIEKLSPLVTQERLETLKNVISKRTQGFVPVLENIYDRGNTSAVMRSAEAFGFYQMHLIEKENQVFKSANRVTQGADKWIDTRVFNSTQESIKDLKSKNYQIFATHLDSAQPLDSIDFSKPTALIFGNEKDGVEQETLKHIDGTVIIPMQGFSQSFNISVAAALCFYHVFQYRKNRLKSEGDLSSNQQEALLANYLYRSVKNPLKCLLL